MLIYKKEFLLNLIFLFLANLLIKPYYIFFIEREFQNQVGTTAWGIYFTLFSMSMIPQILLDFGMTSYMNRKIAAHRTEAALVWQQTNWWRPVFALLFLIGYLILTAVSGYWVEYSGIISWIAINQILLASLLFIRAYISGLGHYRLDSLFSIADKLLFILLILFAGMVFPFDRLNSFLILQFLSLLLPVLLGLIWIAVNLKARIFLFNFSHPLKVLLDCLPYAGIFLFMVLFCRMEPVWIDLLRSDGPYQAGIYAAAYRLVDAANMLGFLFAGILLPMFSHAWTSFEKTNVQSLFDLSWKLMSAGAIWISIPVVFYHRYIMDLLYTDGLNEVLNPLMLNLIPLTLNYLLSTLLTAANRARHLNRLFLISIAINGIGHLCFTWNYGAWGAALVALLTQCSTTIMMILYIKHQNLVVLHGNHFKQVVFILGIMIALGVLLSFAEINPMMELIVFFSASLLILVFSGLIPVKSMYQLIFRRLAD